MKKSKIQLVIIFSILALVGSIAVQYYWISKLYYQNKFLFDQNVNRALKFAVNDLQKHEDLYRIHKFRSSQSMGFIPEVDSQYISHPRSVSYIDNNNESKIIVKSSNHNKKDVVVFQNSFDYDFDIFNSEELDSILKIKNLSTSIQIKIDNDSITQTFESMADSLIQVLEFKTIDIQKERENLESTIDQLVWEMEEWTMPFLDSIPSDLIESILHRSLEEYHLPTDFEYAIIENKNNNLNHIFQSVGFDNNDLTNHYFTSLYPENILPRERNLVLQINSTILVDKMSLPIFLSLIFTLMLSIGLWLIIKNLMHHRNISQVQSDFINNMTHEFKTPIATISLASDSILNPGILGNQEKVSYFTGMIKKENKRMNRLVEKILQMARLENKEFKIDFQQTSIHKILDLIVENTIVKIENQGSVELTLKAGNDTVRADQVHITNVFYNLIDNAIKYSKYPIKIEIKSFNTKNHLVVSIKDHGIGMNKKELHHIFDRFYRIEAGNVHNVKGYGLGLTYVKSVIDKHKGTVSVKSEEGKGSEFEISLPVFKKE